MKKLFLFLLPWMAVAVSAAPASTVPISGMPITTNVSDNAYFPLIQPYPGRTTNDNFRATTANIFQGRATVTATNIIVTNLFVTNVIILAGTNVASVNPTIGRLPYKDTTNTFGDSALYFVDTNTVATVELDTENVGVTNLVTGGVVVSFDSGLGFGYLTNFPAGTGALINDGANHLSWDLSGLLWTNNAGVLEPSDLTLPVTIGTNIFRFTLDGALTIGNGSLGELQLNSDELSRYVDIVAQNPATGGSYIHLQDTNGYVFKLDPYRINGTNQAVIYLDTYLALTNPTKLLLFENQGVAQFQVAAETDIGAADGSKLFGSDGKFHNTSGAGTIINATDTYLPARFNGTMFTNSPLYTIQGTNIALDGQMIFGPGTTNVLQRNVNNLEWTNSATTGNGVLFDVINGNGVRARFGVDQDEQVAVIAPAGKFIKLEANNGNQVYGASSTGFYPVGTNQALGLGTTTNNFWSYSAIGSSNQWKFLSVTEGVTTNITVNINGKTYTFQAW